MTTLSVPDMTCGHCKASVLSALSAIPDSGTIDVDLPAKTVSVSGAAPSDTLIKALDSVGFPASVIAPT